MSVRQIKGIFQGKNTAETEFSFFLKLMENSKPVRKPQVEMI